MKTAITRLISQEIERAASDREQMLTREFMTAYADLRRVSPEGDLWIHLFTSPRDNEESEA